MASGENAYSDAWRDLADKVKAGAEKEEIAAAAARLAPLFVARVNPIHAAMRGLGLPAPTLIERAEPLVEFKPNYARLAFVVAEEGGREVTADFTVNGSAFHGGRRYEAEATRIDLSDAEIARTGVLRVERGGGGRMTVTLLTFDGYPAKLTVEPGKPFAPVLDGKVPDAALALFRQRPESASLAQLAGEAAAIAKRRGATKGFFARLLDGVARQAHADLAVLGGYLAGQVGVVSEERDWAERPEQMRRVVEAALRQLADSADGGIRLLIVIAIGHVLAGLRA